MSSNHKTTNHSLDRMVESILDVTERNSVIEGLPAFSDQFRSELRASVRQALKKGTQS